MSKDLAELQSQILEFAVERKWDKNMTMNIFNMLCNISEESGEVWNVIKWINDDEDMQKVIDTKREDLKDGIGDLLWCVARLALFFEVDMFDALHERLVEYRERFPIDKVINKKSNPTLGGYDGKYKQTTDDRKQN